ncbi:hypothetical protein Tco_0659202 [Tanacetum coccineum]
MSKSAWTEKDHIDNFLKERRLMRSLEKVDPHGFEGIYKDGHGGTWFQLTHRFIAACSYLTDIYKDTMKAQFLVHISKNTCILHVPVTTFVEPPLLSVTTLPPPPTPLITHLQQTPVPTPPTVPSSPLQDLPNFGSLFGFNQRLKTLENNFSEFNQTNQFAAAVSSVPSIVDAYLANKMHKAVKTDVQLQSERLRDEAQAKNADFLNKLDDNIKKIIKD